MPSILPGYTPFILVVLAWGCTRTPNIDNPVNKVTIKSADLNLTVTKDSSAADGFTPNIIQFHAGPSVDSFYHTVTFSIAPNGLFSNDSTQITLPIDINGQAEAYAVSRILGTMTVTASVAGSAEVQKPVTFTFAWPTQMLITIDSTFLTPILGNWTEVTATLLRNQGSVSPGVFINFSDSTTADSLIGSAVADSSGIASIRYYIPDTGYHGAVFINGVVMTPIGPVEGTGRVQVK